ncbi:unnamed protein product [Rotaria magnacalcarata]|uniref:Uncharacterized protein n=1 Tax=Rotaria magnacalcarata TaxID=392030 RepID=A0A8S3HIC5_9BILA|nr:unnamed protein product [Rotaria magnacalcarata]
MNFIRKNLWQQFANTYAPEIVVSSSTVKKSTACSQSSSDERSQSPSLKKHKIKNNKLIKQQQQQLSKLLVYLICVQLQYGIVLELDPTIMPLLLRLHLAHHQLNLVLLAQHGKVNT